MEDDRVMSRVGYDVMLNCITYPFKISKKLVHKGGIVLFPQSHIWVIYSISRSTIQLFISGIEEFDELIPISNNY